jgi:uncharacterized protein
MAGASDSYHEPYELLSDEAKDLHRAIVSLQEELEAVDWYNQRADVTKDEALKRILIHNRDEEIEHAMMTLEWIRRRVPKFDEEMRTYLFTDPHEITEVEEAKMAGGAATDGHDSEAGRGASPSVGSMRRSE